MTGYHAGKEWARFVRMAKPIIAATLPAPCVQRRCQLGGIVYSHQRWHVGHLPGRDHALMRAHPTLADVGPSHQKCNTSDGAKLGHQLRAKRTARDTRQSRLGDR